MSGSSATSDQVTPATESTVETELSKLVKQEVPKMASALESNAERIRSSVARLSSSSIDDLEALTAELKKMQDFLRSEVDNVQRQIEGALAGINIIVETIAPWKNAASFPPMSTRPYRPGPAAGFEVAPSRRMVAGVS